MATSIMWHVCIKLPATCYTGCYIQGCSSKQRMHVCEQQLMPVLEELSFGAGLSGDLQVSFGHATVESLV